MDIIWHDRLVTRMINNNPVSTIGDYYHIVDHINNPLPEKDEYERPGVWIGNAVELKIKNRNIRDKGRKLLPIEPK